MAARRLATTPQAQTRYSLVHGCYSLSSPSRGTPIAASAGPFTMQAAALGVYLLYGPQGDYLTDDGTGDLAGASTPGAATEWTVDGSSAQGFTMTNDGTGTRLPVTFVPATGCAPYPEAQVDATGTPFGGASPEADVLGTVEGHAHVTAFEFLGGDWHCGRPWSPFGVTYALPASCAADEQGSNGAFESFMDFGGPTRPTDMHGWPTFVDWPSPTAVAEEGDYYTGIERAWKAGLRLMVTDLVDNEALCSLMTTSHNPCNDMDAVKIQNGDVHALQDYIDAQSGGPGKGWFRIVTDPFQARRVINQGKLAVIEGIEVSRIFGCGEVNDVPQCDQSQIDAGLKEIHGLGVRTFFPIHEFDNAFGGTKMIAGELGTVVNAGNRDETGSFWTLQPCPASDQDAAQVSVPSGGTLAGLVNGPLATLLHGSPLPVYGDGPQCNVRGITDLGTYVINQMISDHFLIQLDHMDSA
ncbi:MAG: Coagulation factor 5/8 type domain-containing protein, partial [Solirubrobacteraceae bacterium]